MIRVAALAALALALAGCEGREQVAARNAANAAEYQKCLAAGMIPAKPGIYVICESPKPGLPESRSTVQAGSGLTVHTDPLTGCQYLESRTGYLVQRIDDDRMPVCNEDGLRRTKGLQ